MEEDDMVELEAIQGRRETARGKEFWIKYKDFSLTENEWQPLTNMSNATEQVSHYESSFHRFARSCILDYALATKQCAIVRVMFDLMEDEQIKQHASDLAVGFMMWEAAVADIGAKVKDVRTWLDIFCSIVRDEELDLDARGDFYDLALDLIEQTLLQCACKCDWILFSRQLNALLPNHHVLAIRKLSAKLRDQTAKGEDTLQTMSLIRRHRAYHRLRENLRTLLRRATAHPSSGGIPKCITDACLKAPLAPVFMRCHQFLKARIHSPEPHLLAVAKDVSSMNKTSSSSRNK